MMLTLVGDVIGEVFFDPGLSLFVETPDVAVVPNCFDSC